MIAWSTIDLTPNLFHWNLILMLLIMHVKLLVPIRHHSGKAKQSSQIKLEGLYLNSEHQNFLKCEFVVYPCPVVCVVCHNVTFGICAGVLLISGSYSRIGLVWCFIWSLISTQYWCKCVYSVHLGPGSGNLTWISMAFDLIFHTYVIPFHPHIRFLSHGGNG